MGKNRSHILWPIHFQLAIDNCSLKETGLLNESYIIFIAAVYVIIFSRVV